MNNLLSFFKPFTKCIAIAALLAGICSAASVDLKQNMLDNLDFIANIYKSGYAPFEWKKQQFQWDVDEQVDAAKSKVELLNPPTVKTYQKILSDFFFSTRDYHVFFNYCATESARLFFTVKGTNGKYFIVGIDRNRLPKDVFPFSVGDELVSFDGKPASEAVAQVKKEQTITDYPTDTATAELFLTLRPAQMGMNVPAGDVTIVVRPQGKKSDVSCTLQWQYVPEFISNDVVRGQPQPYFAQSGSSTYASTLLNRSMVTPLSQFLAPYVLEENPYFLGTRKSYIPSLGVKIWQSKDKSLFHAYMYLTKERKKIGYIRIPNYSGSAAHTQEFANILRIFEKSTDALVIDEINNPGGSLFYIYALIRHLASSDIIVPTHREAITQSMVFDAIYVLGILQNVTNDEEAQKAIEALGADLQGFPVDYQMIIKVREYFVSIIDQWNSGKKLTDDAYIFGVKSIAPDASIHYTKPILLVVNSLDYSGGDFFPAILQDNKRVTVFGTRTAGAGGYVNTLPYPNYLGIQYFSYTGSIAKRLNGDPIENLGVTPDINYTLTHRDFRTNYKDYVKAINAAVVGLLH
ncbi:MAG: protease-like activity factor CPAF [Chitinivibrionales bacterium]|nr:protease-like activity factor CPAF [Chitinivibrionales bacterium]